ncbi:hypothetical protein [Vibrio owensii]|uniref:hypothetical protein n=1 Tax=Vibrio owensii TaxID=696485 RepID=UPI003CC64735
MSEHKDTFEKISQQILQDRILKENAVKLVRVHFTDKDEHAVSDKNAENWARKLLSSWLENPEKHVDVYLSTNVMFNHLRVALKQGEIEKMIAIVDGEAHDFILPNGKLFGIAAPDCFFLDEKALMQLI